MPPSPSGSKRDTILCHRLRQGHRFHPYDYALEVLAEGRGLVASDADPEELAQLIDKIFSNPKLKERLEQRAGKLGKTMSWPQVGKRYVDIIGNIMQLHAKSEVF